MEITQALARVRQTRQDNRIRRSSMPLEVGVAKFSTAVGGLNDKDKGEGRGVWNAPNAKYPSASRALPVGSSGSEILIARGPEHVSARAMPSSACEFTIKNDARKGRGGRRSLHAEGGAVFRV